jgi:hypothetical protein
MYEYFLGPGSTHKWRPLSGSFSCRTNFWLLQLVTFESIEFIELTFSSFWTSTQPENIHENKQEMLHMKHYTHLTSLSLSPSLYVCIYVYVCVCVCIITCKVYVYACRMQHLLLEYAFVYAAYSKCMHACMCVTMNTHINWTKACVTALTKPICNDAHTHHACADMRATLDMYLSCL